ncbi:DNA-binding response regulator, NarL/FixJ family, contains REC and HTH domains [Streptomyces sp. OV198]|nr:DNA-binding response regulator, NarL/FixJ family, contains REC and HTH domains [Streptomyces sp. OV198]
MVSGAPVIRVMVVDDEALIRKGFQYILDAAQDIEVAAAVPGSQALQVAQEICPDVVLLDIRMPDVDGLTVLAGLRRLSHLPVVAMLATIGMDEHVATALRSGAAGFLLKDTDPEQLPSLVRTLAAGGTVMSSKVTRTVVDACPNVGPQEPAARDLARLTDRERAVLVLIGKGLSNSDIATRMQLSTSTVKDDVSAILTELKVGGRIQASRLAEWACLLKPPRDQEGG